MHTTPNASHTNDPTCPSLPPHADYKLTTSQPPTLYSLQPDSFDTMANPPPTQIASSPHRADAKNVHLWQITRRIR